MVQSHQAPAWKGRILRHKIDFFVLGTFQKRRHPKNVGSSLGIGERLVIFACNLFCCCSESPVRKPLSRCLLWFLIFGLVVKTTQDKTTLFNQGSPISCKAGTTLFNQGSPISCKAGILRGPGFNKTYIYTFTIKLQGELKFAKITEGKKNQIKCPLRRRLKISRELASLILLGSDLKAKRPEFLKVRPPRTRFVVFIL